jgi:uncharacterized protein (TIGR02147 family)
MTNPNTLEDKPSIFDFTNYREFLKAFYEWQKLVNPEYSYRVFSDRAGLKSRSYLRLVLAGKRSLTPDSISKFVAGLALTRLEADAFTSLVHFNQSTDSLARAHYWDLFSSLCPKKMKSQMVHDTYAYLTRMMYPILLILLRQSNVSHEVKDLAAMTGMTMAEVNEAIMTFSSMGALLKTSDGRYRVTSPSFDTGNDVQSLAIPIFHRNMLKAAVNCTDLPQIEREFQSVMMPLDEREFLYLKTRLRDLAEEIDVMFGRGSRPHTNRVYSLNLNLVPMTPDFIRDTKAKLDPHRDKPAVASQNSSVYEQPKEVES